MPLVAIHYHHTHSAIEPRCTFKEMGKKRKFTEESDSKTEGGGEESHKERRGREGAREAMCGENLAAALHQY